MYFHYQDQHLGVMDRRVDALIVQTVFSSAASV